MRNSSPSEFAQKIAIASGTPNAKDSLGFLNLVGGRTLAKFLIRELSQPLRQFGKLHIGDASAQVWMIFSEILTKAMLSS